MDNFFRLNMKRLYILLALAAILASCSVDIDWDDPIKNPKGSNTDINPRMVTEVISGTHSASTKATIADSDGAFAWTEGDNLAVHISSDNGSDHKYVVTSSGASDAAVTAAFEVMYEAGYARDAFAIFPSTIVAAAAANYGQSGASLDVTLPGSYTLAQVTGEKTPCPMIATNAAGTSWTFYQLCGLLRLKVSNIPANTKRLEINFDDKQVWGDFSIKSPVTPNSSAISTAADADHDIITITKNGSDVVIGEVSLVLNIPLPTGTYSNITVTAYDALTAGNITHTMTHAFAYSAKRTDGTKIVSTFPGFFSVSSTKKVIFAPGNLQYLGKANGTGTWRFAEHQYDYMGDGPSSGTSFQGNVDYTNLGYSTYNTGSGSNPPTDGDKIAARDLFSWGTSGYNDKYPYMTSTNSDSYYNGSMVGDNANYDWGVYHSASGSSTEKITNGGNKSWRLLTSEEWNYVMNRKNKVYTRDDYKESKKLYCDATLKGITTNDIKGLIVFPDGWTGDAFRTIKYQDAGYDKNVFNAVQWAMLEEMGCVFLPAAHFRDGSTIKNVNEGRYWSSTIQPSVAGEYRGGCIEFWSGSSLFSVTNKEVRKFGQSVRLIREVE